LASVAFLSLRDRRYEDVQHRSSKVSRGRKAVIRFRAPKMTRLIKRRPTAVDGTFHYKVHGIRAQDI
jgi:hypothetical protein